MWTILLPLLKKYGLYVVLLFVIGYYYISNQSLQDKYTKLESNIAVEKQLKNDAIQKALIIESTLNAKYTQEAYLREKEYNEKYQKLVADYSKLQSTTNDRLSNVTTNIRNRVLDSNTSTETRIEYIDRYEQVFGKCVQEYTRVARDLGEVGLERDLLKNSLNAVYAQVEEFKLLNPETIIK